MFWWWWSEDHFEVWDTGLFEVWSFWLPAELFVEADGSLLSVAVELCEAEFSEGALFDSGDEESADALALSLWVYCHLHELAGGLCGVVWEEECAADDFGAGVVA